MAGETHHVKGFDGVKDARKWLDRTTRARVMFDAYDDERWVTVTLLTGKREGYDLYGVLLDENGQETDEFYAECKNQDSDSKAGAAFDEFICNAYSAVAKRRADGDPAWLPEFLFITWHPFRVKTWISLCTAETVIDRLKDAVTNENRNDVLGGVEVDEALAAQVAKRLWLVVLCERQVLDLTMSGDLLGMIRQQQTDKTRPSGAST